MNNKQATSEQPKKWWTVIPKDCGLGELSEGFEPIATGGAQMLDGIAKRHNAAIAGERLQENLSGNDDIKVEQPQPEQQNHNLGSERGGYLHNGKTAREWFDLHEELRQDYGRAIKELEAQDGEIRKHEESDTDRAQQITSEGG